MNIKIKEFKEKQKNKLEEFKEKQKIKLEDFKEKLKINLKEFKEKQKNKKIKGGTLRKYNLFSNTDTILLDEDIDLYIEYIIANLIFVFNISYKNDDKYRLNISNDNLLNYINHKNKTNIDNLKDALSDYIDKITIKLFSNHHLENDDYFIELLSIPTDNLVKIIKDIPPFTTVDSIDIMITSIISTYVFDPIYKYTYKKNYCKGNTHDIDNKENIIKINGKCYDILILIKSIIEDLNKIDPIYPRILDVADSKTPISINLQKNTLKKIYKYIKDKNISIKTHVDLFFKNLNIFRDENTQEIKKLFVDNNLHFSFELNEWEELSKDKVDNYILDITKFINKFDNTNINSDNNFEDNTNGINNNKYNNDIYYKNIISNNDKYEKLRLNKLKKYILDNKKIDLLNKPVEVFLNNIDKLKLTPRDNFKKNINEIFKNNNIVYNSTNNKWE